MDKLNELVEMAKEISSKNWFINSDEEVTAIDNDAGPDDSEEVFIGCAANIQLAKYIAAASPENIIAIDEAFRALERENITLKQGCENNPLVHELVDMRERAEAAEAQLEELAKQEPAFLLKVDSRDSEQYQFDIRAKLSDGVHELFTRPAPAVSLAELVQEYDLNRVFDFAKFVIKCVRKDGEYSPLSSQEPDEIDAILRNIEEGK